MVCFPNPNDLSSNCMIVHAVYKVSTTSSMCCLLQRRLNMAAKQMHTVHLHTHKMISKADTLPSGRPPLRSKQKHDRGEEKTQREGSLYADGF